MPTYGLVLSHTRQRADKSLSYAHTHSRSMVSALSFLKLTNLNLISVFSFLAKRRKGEKAKRRKGEKAKRL